MSIFERLRDFFGGAPNKDDSHGEGSPDGMISCEEALRLVHEFIDGELEAVSAEEVQRHFDVCQRCYPHLHLESTFREALRRAAGAPAAPAGLRDRLTSMIAEERAGE